MSLSEIETVAGFLARSTFFKDAGDLNKAVAKILAGHEIGLGPFASMANVYIVQGRATLSYVMMASAIKKSGRYNYRVSHHDEKKCVIDFVELDPVTHSWQPCGSSTFTMDDAVKAGLTKNPTWKTYPRNMLFARALSNGAKWYCADVFGGNTPYTPDEIEPDYVLDAEGNPVQNPARASAATTRPLSGTRRRRTRARAEDVAQNVVDAEVVDVASDRRSRLEALLDQLQVDRATFLKFYEVESIADLEPDSLAHAIGVLEQRRDMVAQVA